ncbi:HEAT repeat-containing protein 5B-like isoform X1 [Penaeus chinensis]|uniref:HEAT repeat-containing protein 5B-like isoform X1 n=1 Tax=Penaeus chinensis TaxID=139456 RepID=UPI001FB5C113|nr:HEAT repeat-containing protein 5B-like isoform X1 [Penaeus chinensis]XP_047496502.1 HEAT repeat-containing protein 5B-like isoform X1 [Penaeus chinensis]XP_047496505.1 HEAT repeat-containing protein 5B-like isoform X1 [Penaeus chinensis]
MMELSHSLTLNEEALKQLPPAKRPIFIFEWLRFLDKVLEAAHKVRDSAWPSSSGQPNTMSDIKGCQKQLVAQLVGQMNESPGPPTRKLVARCLATLFSVGDTFLLFDTINKCNDVLKNKDDSPSYLPTRLAAVTCIGAMYEKLGRMMGRSYEETVQILLKALRNAESQLRIEIMMTLEKITAGMGTAAGNVHKDIYKAAKMGLTDRALPVRCASALCLMEMTKHAPFLYTTEIENLSQLCYRAFDNSNYDVRCTVAKLLGTVLATTQNPPKEFVKGTSKGGPLKLLSLEEALTVLLTGFLRGGNSFLKGTGEMIKGSSSVSREVRVGITQAYVVLVQELGALWLERNIPTLLALLTELVASPKATTSHVDAVYSRKCINFILRATLGRMIGEKAQIAACKEITQLIIKHMNTVDVSGESTKDGNEGGQHVLVCLLQELGSLMQSLSTTCATIVLDTHLNLVDAVVAVLLHPSSAARLSASWCLRCICIALPSQLHPLISRCCDRLDTLKSSPEAIAGYSCVVSALVGCVQKTPLGIPHMRGKVLFNIAEELLRSASQNSRLSLQRTQAGWLIIGSIMTLGIGVVRGLLPRMLLLWKNSFPRSSKEIESEKARGDAFTWQVTLEGRAGALASMHSFLLHCSDLAAEDTVRRLLLPIEAALLMLSSITHIVKQYGQHLKASTAMVRLRLYEVLALLPPQSFESHYTSILKLLVSEFTLAESGANTTTSLLRTMCHADDSIILGTWLHHTHHKAIEDQLQANSASGSGALEHDSTFLYRPLPEGESVAGPLPLGVAVIDASVILFGQMFPLVANKHRLKMLNLFGDMIRAAKSQRQEAVQMNIFTAVLSALKGLSDNKASFGQDDVKKAATSLLLGGLTHPNSTLRCASGEAIGRMAQVVGDPRFVAEMAQNSFDKLKSARDAVSRTGHSLALGCLHRYVGGMGSGQHLSTSISILLALAKDTTSPVVQVWALHALSMIADSGGPMFRSYVEPSLALLLELLLTVPLHTAEVHQCIGKCLQALITTVGPELQGTSSSVVMVRWSLLCGCELVQEHPDPLVQAEAIACLQQMHMFAPRHVNLSSLVPMLVRKLSCNHLLLRRSAVSCLRQLSQREAWEVCEHALSLVQGNEDSDQGLMMTETGLPGVLFGLLDTETDCVLVRNVHHTLTSTLQALATSHLNLWLTLCREVLTSASESGSGEETGEAGDGGDDDDMVQIHTGGEPDPHPSIPPRWTTRVFAAQCIAKIIQECENNRAHFDLALAREMQTTKMKGDYLVLHLSELVRMGFMGATSDSDDLRLEGLHILHLVIDKFAHIPEPEFPGHVILEQYQAQVGAALRPAFAPETASHVTARACEVCSAWICSGVARDLNDLRRVHQLLVSSLAKLNKGNTKGLYNESAATLEKLAILKAWAEVYAVALKGADGGEQNENGEDERPEAETVTQSSEESLLSLVQPELVALSKSWLAALKDHALLSLPPEFSSQLPHDGGAFYSNESVDGVRPYYRSAWPPMLYAAALWLSSGGFDKAGEEEVNGTDDNPTSVNITSPTKTPTKSAEVINTDRFYLLLGICLEWLCSPIHSDDPDRSIVCLKSLETLLSSPFPMKLVGPNSSLTTEIATVMHRQVLSSDHTEVHQLAVTVVSLVVKAAQQALDEEKRKKKKHKDEKPANQECEGCEADLLGEGKESGEINSAQSLVFTALQVCLCTLVRHKPRLAPQVVSSAPSLLAPPRHHAKSHQVDALLSSTVTLLTALPNLCSPAGGVAILPTVLYLITGVLKECGSKARLSHISHPTPVPMVVVLDALATLARHPYARDHRSQDQWCSLLQSALANIIDLSKTSDDERVIDEVVVLRGIAQLILHAPASVSRPHNLQYPAINLFKMATQHQQLNVRIQCIQTLESIFSHTDGEVSTPYIHALAPRLLEYLHESHANVSSEEELQLITESISAMELLIPRTLPEHRNELVGVLVGIMVGALQDTNRLSSVSQHTRQLHQYALSRLQKIGPQYPQEFRAVLTSKPELRLRLESAVRSQQEARSKADNNASQDTMHHQPTIKLKTDFSNFASKT